MPECHLVVLGHIDESTKRILTNSQFAHRMHVVSGLSGTETRTLLNVSKVLCFPSLYEGFGIPIIEAQYEQTAVVTSHAGALQEVVLDSGLIVDPENVENIASAVKAVLLDKKLEADLVERGIQNARRFSRARWASEHTMFFRGIFDNQSGSVSAL